MPFGPVGPGRLPLSLAGSGRKLARSQVRSRPGTPVGGVIQSVKEQRAVRAANAVAAGQDGGGQ